MTAIDLEHAHLLASKLMWKRFADEKPKDRTHVLLQLNKDQWTVNVFVAWLCPDRNIYSKVTPPMWRDRDGSVLDSVSDSDLWLYLSDLDVLRVKG